MMNLVIALALQSYDDSIAKIKALEAKAETPEAKVDVGDSYVKLASKFPKKRQELVDTASTWYAKAWPDLDALWKLKTREQLDRIYAPARPGKASSGRPTGWGGITDESSLVDVSNRKAHTGGAALRIATSR